MQPDPTRPDPTRPDTNGTGGVQQTPVVLLNNTRFVQFRFVQSVEI
jgi:hypothetical protein